MQTVTTITDNPDSTYPQVGGCGWCNGLHQGLCPLVLEMEYFDAGNIKRVKFVSLEERARLGADVRINVKLPKGPDDHA